MELTRNKHRAIVPSTPPSDSLDHEIWINDIENWNKELKELKEYVRLASLAVENHEQLYKRHLERIWNKGKNRASVLTKVPNYGYEGSRPIRSTWNEDSPEGRYVKLKNMHQQLKRFHKNVLILTGALRNAFKN